MTLEEIEGRTEQCHCPVCEWKDADIRWLIQRIKDLELTRSRAERCCCIFDEDGETILRWCDGHAIWRDRVKELEAERQDGALAGQATMEEAYNRITVLEAELRDYTKTVERLNGELDRIHGMREQEGA